MSFPTALEEVIEDIRSTHRELDAAGTDLARIRGESEIASDRLDRAATRLNELREKMYEIVVQKPVVDDEPQVEVVNTYNVAPPVRVAAAWSDENKGVEV